MPRSGSTTTSFIRRTLAASAIVTTAALSACSASGTGSGDPSTLTFAIANDPLVFNPAANGSGNDTWYVNRQIYDSLVYQDPETLEITPWLASSFSSNPDATEYTFTLRDDVTFSDGTPLDADTVKANFDDIKAAGAAASGIADLGNYAGTDVVDEHTIVVRFTEPNASFLAAVAGVPLAIVSKPSLSIPFAERASGTDVHGSGPFTLGDYVKDDSVTLDRRDDFSWAPESFNNRSAAHLETVKFSVVPESGNRTGGLSSGQLDVAGGIAPNDISAVEGSSTLISRANPGTVFGLYFNFDQQVFEDEKVREAVSLAVDPTEVRDGATDEHFNVATSPVSSTTQDHADVSSLIDVGDPERAAAILDEAGWKPGPDGIRAKDGKPLAFRITYSTNFGPNADSIAIVQEQLRKVGIDSSQKTGTVPELQSIYDSGEFDLSWQNLSRTDSDVLRLIFGEGGGTYSRPVADADVQAQLSAQVGIGDKKERTAALAKVQSDLVSKHEVIPFYELTTLIGARDHVSGLTLGADSRLDLLVDTQKSD